MSRTFNHRQPQSDTANIVVRAPVGVDDEYEALWGIYLSEQRVQIKSISAFLYDIALDDIVLTTSDYTVTSVESRSGRRVVRFWFYEVADRSLELSDLASVASQIEMFSPRLLLADCADETVTAAVVQKFTYMEAEGVGTWERGWTTHA